MSGCFRARLESAHRLQRAAGVDREHRHRADAGLVGGGEQPAGRAEGHRDRVAGRGWNGLPTAVSLPSAATENTDTVPGLVWLAVASSPPDGLNATETGSWAWVGTGGPTAVSAPSAATENTDTVPSVEFAVASSPPDGLNATEAGPAPGHKRGARNRCERGLRQRARGGGQQTRPRQPNHQERPPCARADHHRKLNQPTRPGTHRSHRILARRLRDHYHSTIAPRSELASPKTGDTEPAVSSAGLLVSSLGGRLVRPSVLFRCWQGESDAFSASSWRVP